MNIYWRITTLTFAHFRKRSLTDLVAWSATWESRVQLLEGKFIVLIWLCNRLKCYLDQQRSSTWPTYRQKKVSEWVQTRVQAVWDSPKPTTRKASIHPRNDTRGSQSTVWESCSQKSKIKSPKTIKARPSFAPVVLSFQAAELLYFPTIWTKHKIGPRTRKTHALVQRPLTSHPYDVVCMSESVINLDPPSESAYISSTCNCQYQCLIRFSISCKKRTQSYWQFCTTSKTILPCIFSILQFFQVLKNTNQMYHLPVSFHYFNRFIYPVLCLNIYICFVVTILLPSSCDTKSVQEQDRVNIRGTHVELLLGLDQNKRCLR